MINENSDVRFIKGVGEKRAELLNKIGIYTVFDLLHYFPRTYRDWSVITEISDALIGDVCCIKAIVDKNTTSARIKNGLTVFKTKVSDCSGKMTVTIFNNKFAAKNLIQGQEYYFYGKINGNLYSKEMTSPEILKAENSNNIIHPIYPQSNGINSKYLEKIIKAVFSSNPNPCEETLPDEIREKLCLMKINDALKEIHFPSDKDLKAEAERRLVFEELYTLQLGLMLLKGIKKAESDIIIDNYSKDFFSYLPFSPTNAQIKAVNDCTEQMNSGLLMNRLLQGDVGSGKTMVAASLMYNTVKSGYQCAFMAPTEILAEQHYRTMCSFFEKTGFNISILTGSTPAKDKKTIKEKLKNNEINIIIGTHALIQSDVIFNKIGLVVTDEQHRFGVKQRNALTDKGTSVHTLVMSATPIPRTLALIIYGDLDISILDELPPGRQPVETFHIDSKKRIRAYNYVKKHLDEGRQGYIVCPLVEESDVLELAAAEEYAKNLAGDTFSNYTVGIVHGKMKPKDKETVMSRFAKGEIQLLVSTTVIEVGVDVPNAVIMIIENAERFGLSQLHQLRGRIGRGQYKSTCILISDAQNESAVKRMKTMVKTTNGFEIADEDLKLRGPGDFFGNKQHGLPEMKIAMLTDSFTLKEANRFAKETIIKDCNLELPENSALKKSVLKLFENKTLN